MGTRRYLERSASQTSTIKPYSRSGQKKDCSWSLSQRSTSWTRWSTFRSLLWPFTRAQGVFCASDMTFTRNATQPFLLSSAQLLPRMIIRPRSWNKYSPIPCASISMTFLQNVEMEWAQQTTTAVPSPICRHIFNLNRTCGHRWPFHRSEHHSNYTCSTKMHHR